MEDDIYSKLNSNIKCSRETKLDLMKFDEKVWKEMSLYSAQ